MSEPAAFAASGAPGAASEALDLRRGPPMGAWKIAGGVLAVFFALAVGAIVKIDPYRSPEFEHHGEELVRAWARDPADKKVLFLGRSTLRRAIYSESDMEERAKTEGLGEIRMLKLIGIRAIVSDFDVLFDDFFAAKPDVIFLDSAMVVEARNWGPRLKLGFRYLEWLRAGREEWRPAGTFPHVLDRFDPPCGSNVASDPEQLAWWTKERTTRFRHSSTGPAADAARDFLRRASEHGIRVVLIELPLTEQLEASRERREHPEVKKLLGEVTRLPNVIYREYDGKPSAADFCDPVHLNEAGRERYTKWILWLLATELAR